MIAKRKAAMLKNWIAISNNLIVGQLDCQYFIREVEKDNTGKKTTDSKR